MGHHQHGQHRRGQGHSRDAARAVLRGDCHRVARQDKAEATARSLGIPKAYGSYEALLDDPDIDAVYIPTPNHLHVPWSIRAIQAGKHVLVEKPIALDADEAVTLQREAARHPRLKVMEAFMYRFHPAVGSREGHRRRRPDWRAADDPDVVFVLRRRSDERAEPEGHRRRRRPDGHRLLPDFALALDLRRGALAGRGHRRRPSCVRR